MKKEENALAKAEAKLNKIKKLYEAAEKALRDAQASQDKAQDKAKDKSKKDDKEIEKAYPWNDLGNAQRFFDLYHDIVRYSAVDKRWYVYDGKTWHMDKTNKIDQLAIKVNYKMQMAESKAFMKFAPDKAPKLAWQNFVKSSGNQNRLSAMINALKPFVPVEHGAFNKNPLELNVENGILNMQTRQLAPHNSNKMLDKIIPVNFDEQAKCPKWEAFINQILKGDQSLIKFLQRAIGYSLTGDTSEQVMFLLVGNGKNGKSVLINTIAKLMGNYAKNMSASTIMLKRDGSTHGVARLEDARLVISSESNEGARLDESLVKGMTGNDTMVARYLYGSEFEYTPKFKLWMATNHKPIIRGTDKGIWRRIVTIPFNYTVPESAVDKHLETKLERELPGILNWALDGTEDWLAHGLQIPQIVDKENEDYRHQMDVVAQFSSDCLKKAAVDRIDHPVKSSTVYQIYRKWAEINGAYVMSNVRFSLELQKSFRKIHKSDGNYFPEIILNEEAKRIKNMIH